MSTVLLTGAAGYVGSHTALELLEMGYNVIALDNCINAFKAEGKEKPTSISEIESISGKSVSYHDVDLLNQEDLIVIFKKYKIDIVIHFAALKAVGESISEPLRYYRNNMMGTINLVTAMQMTGVNKLVFSSSATVYGKPQSKQIDEDHPTGQSLTNPYGQTKHMCEQILIDVAKAEKAFKVVLLRYFNPVGAHKSGRIGEDPKGKPNNLMPFIAQVSVGKRPHVEVFGTDFETPDGTGVRDYIHVVDLAKGHVAALKKINEPTFSGHAIYNLGTGKGVSVLDMIKAYSSACGKNLPYKLTGRRSGDVDTVVAKCEKAKLELNWQAEKTLQDMCVDSWRWQSMHPEGYADVNKN